MRKSLSSCDSYREWASHLDSALAGMMAGDDSPDCVLVAVLDGANETKHWRGTALLQEKFGILRIRFCGYVREYNGRLVELHNHLTSVDDGCIALFTGAHCFDRAVGTAYRLHADLYAHNFYCNYGWEEQVHARIAIGPTAQAALGLLWTWQAVSRGETVFCQSLWHTISPETQTRLVTLGASPDNISWR